MPRRRFLFMGACAHGLRVPDTGRFDLRSPAAIPLPEETEKSSQEDAAAASVARRDVLRATAVGAGSMSVLGTTGLLSVQISRLLQPTSVGSEWQDPLAQILRSSAGSEMRLERQRLQEEWRREGHAAGRAQVEAAFAVVMRVRRVLGECVPLLRSERDDDLWRETVDAKVTSALVAELERASTVLATAGAVLSAETRREIGWPWGACGWRACGAQADAVQALSKLRVNLGMASTREARYYVDVAMRAVDEVLRLGVSEGMLPASQLPASEYLSPSELDALLAVDDELAHNGAADSHKVLGTQLRGEKQLDLEEQALLEEQAAAAFAFDDGEGPEWGEAEDDDAS